MQFLLQIPLASAGDAFANRDQDLLIFQCANDPGLCEEWDPAAGGNVALLVSRPGAQPMDPLVTDVSTLSSPIVLPEVALAGSDIEPANGAVGMLSGDPDWLQGDESQICSCGLTMQFVLSLEEHVTEGINFGGGGIGYAFACSTCEAEARWLFQC